MIYNSSVVERECNLIRDEYLSDIYSIGDRVNIKKRPCTSEEILFNGKYYYLYDYSIDSAGIYHITLIPKNIDFGKEYNDDVISFVVGSNGYDFVRYSFHNDTIDREIYSFVVAMALDDTTLTKYNSSYVFDKKEIDDILKKNGTYELFFSTYDFIHYLNSHKKFSLCSSISRRRLLPLEDEKIETRYVSRDMSSMESMLNSFIDSVNGDGYTIIEDNDTPFFELMKKIKVFKVNLKK